MRSVGGQASSTLDPANRIEPTITTPSTKTRRRGTERVTFETRWRSSFLSQGRSLL